MAALLVAVIMVSIIIYVYIIFDAIGSEFFGVLTNLNEILLLTFSPETPENNRISPEYSLTLAYSS